MTYEISNETYEAIAENFNVTSTYSGLGMYGQVCFGITGDVDDLVQLVVFMSESGFDDFTSEMLTDTQWDNMGLERIYYWPNVIVLPPAETNEEPDEMKVF